VTVIEEIGAIMDEMIEIEVRGIIETEATEVDTNTEIGRGTITDEEVEGPMTMMTEGTIHVVVEGRMRVLLSPWAGIGTEDREEKRMPMLLL
jgi:hypothetical protein